MTAQLVVEKPAPELGEDGEPPPVIVHIGITDKPGGDQDVQLSVNGRACLVRRGEDVEIPYMYYEVLKNAVEVHRDALPDGGLGPERKVFPIPFHVVPQVAV